MLTVKLGGWNNLVIVPAPQNRRTRRADAAKKRSSK